MKYLLTIHVNVLITFLDRTLAHVYQVAQLINMSQINHAHAFQIIQETHMVFALRFLQYVVSLNS